MGVFQQPARDLPIAISVTDSSRSRQPLRNKNYPEQFPKRQDQYQTKGADYKGNTNNREILLNLNELFKGGDKGFKNEEKEHDRIKEKRYVL